MQRTLRVLFCLTVLAGMAFAQTTLNGAGATFPYPIYSKWFSEYHKAHGDVEINYQSIGSGGGIRQVTTGTVDFGASDGPMTDEQLQQSKVKIVHIPTVLGAVVPAYNVPGVSGEIKFPADVLANIFLNKISNWNDKAIAAANPGVKFPDQNIIVIHRSDGSGTTYIFTDFLSKVSPDWLQVAGKGTAVKWPVGLGGKGNEGVAGMIRQTPGAIGYIELIYALQNNIPYGSVKNSSGQFIKASLESVTAAAQGVKMPNDYRVSITNPPGKTAYPISSFTWLLIPQPYKDGAKGKIITDFLNWELDNGQGMAGSLSYAPLPKEVADKVRQTIKGLK
ncbi:phosphate ABC transporter substrate-binding protein, PhoT family [Candidatus Koribacter versatilis Ellin345]|uniref:Phosphate-binding protein n=1 Tax=Koribacter versatilis (strain Ellin345) TaxID=204669 RepID=Q1IMC4_KORVE|nr:phosphate ABC transporter substrate-binding protein, PhoT family [Candidatus Koribacter versatilis Ellin345]